MNLGNSSKTIMHYFIIKDNLSWFIGIFSYNNYISVYGYTLDMIYS